MANSGQITARYPRGSFCGRYRFAVLALLLTAFTGACTTSGSNARRAADLPPLQLNDHLVTAAQAYERAPTPDLLAVDADMRDFVQHYTGGIRTKRQRLMMLHRAIRGAATLGIEYDPQAEGTARDTFHRGSANCLAYATLFIALAREAGLSASYQWHEVRPQWVRQGERVVLRKHVNAFVSLGTNEQYRVDIDPLPSQDIVDSRRISDVDAQALYHSNLAMDALAGQAIEEAWLHAVRAVQLSPGTAHLWVNLGAIYRVNGQHRDAEFSYLSALQLDPGEHSAMNNLVVLYELEGRPAERELWAERVARHREGNPYYHASLGQEAAAAGDLARAASHYERALQLAPEDSRLLYLLDTLTAGS
ncbi:MAG: hypothetical protein KDI33_01120 [Halioglobus sp.]|nr:hypothetical protein [Halioglobus sp.]